MYGKHIRSEERHIDYLLMIIAAAVMIYLALTFGNGPAAQQEVTGTKAVQATSVIAPQTID